MRNVSEKAQGNAPEAQPSLYNKAGNEAGLNANVLLRRRERGEKPVNTPSIAQDQEGYEQKRQERFDHSAEMGERLLHGGDSDPVPHQEPAPGEQPPNATTTELSQRSVNCRYEARVMWPFC